MHDLRFGNVMTGNSEFATTNVAERASLLVHEIFIERFAPRLGGLFPTLLAREQATGELDPDADPQALSILILAMGIFPHVAAPIARRVLGIDMREGGSERLLEQSKTLLQRGVVT